MLRKRFVLVSTALALLVTGAIFAQSAVARQGVDDNTAHQTVMSAMSGGYGFYNAASKSFLAMAPAARAMAVTDLVVWAKAYVNSAAFRQEWAKRRDNAMPKAPAVNGTVDDAAKNNQAAQQKQLDDMKKAIQNLPPDQRKAIEAAMAQASAQMQAAAKDPQQQALQRQAIAGQRADDQARYQNDLKNWQQDFPADPKPVIARRLRISWL